MDWESINFDWNRARAFLVTAEAGSLSAAARALGMTQPTLGRQVSALEHELGLQLFRRAGRSLLLTPEGARLLPHMRQMGDAAWAVSVAARGHEATLEDEITVAVSDLHAHWLMPRVLPRLRKKAPGLHVRINVSDTVQSVGRRGSDADIAIGPRPPNSPKLTGILVAHDRNVLYGTPQCLGDAGNPDTPEGLVRCGFVGIADQDRYMARLQNAGIPVTSHDFPVVAANYSLHWEMTRSGLGLGTGPCWLGETDPVLQPVLPNALVFEDPVWLITHTDQRNSPSVHMVQEFLRVVLPDLLSEGPGSEMRSTRPVLT